MKCASSSAILLVLSLALCVAAGAAYNMRRAVRADMADAAQAYLTALSPEVKTRTQYPFDAPQRMDWHFVPRKRPGLAFKDMNDTQRTAARHLLRSALSSQGMLKTESIMELDAVLHDMEKASGGSGSSRDPLNYAISVFGDPANDKPWAWRIEGHHLCLNFTVVDSDHIAVTPAFLGSNPATVKQGPKSGMRVLSLEEDLGRELVKSLDDAQRKEAIIAKDAPADIFTVPGRSLDATTTPTAGLAVSEMKPQQRALVERLLLEFAHNLRQDLSAAEMQRIKDAGFEQIRFAWAGGLEPGMGHYYRLLGPTFIIEYDNTQDHANHVHTIWHDRQRDMGGDLLKEHYQNEHGDKPDR